MSRNIAVYSGLNENKIQGNYVFQLKEAQKAMRALPFKSG